MTELHDRFSAAVELGTRLDVDWRPLERRMRDAIPDLRAASYDSEPSDPEVWCDDHEQPVARCHRDDHLCTGTPLTKRTDPTGDAGASSPYRDAGEYVAWAKRACHALEQMARIAGRYKPDDPRQLAELEEENAKPDGCEFCERAGKWSPMHTAQPTDVGGVLPEPRRCCQGHYDFIRSRQRPPTDEENTHYAKKGKWPKSRTEQTDRMRAAIKTGAWS